MYNNGRVNGSAGGSGVVGTASSTTALQVVAGSNSTCMLKTNGFVYCWGYNVYGQVTGTPTTTSPYIAQGYSPGAGSYAQNTISAGGKHVCGIGYTGGPHLQRRRLRRPAQWHRQLDHPQRISFRV